MAYDWLPEGWDLNEGLRLMYDDFSVTKILNVAKRSYILKLYLEHSMEIPKELEEHKLLMKKRSDGENIIYIDSDDGASHGEYDVDVKHVNSLIGMIYMKFKS